MVVVDPIARTVDTIEPPTRTIFSAGQIATSNRYPGLRIDLAAIFAKL